MGKIAKEYIVTLKSYADLEEFYNDMETEGTTRNFVPSRAVECLARRPISRNTNYKITDDEARALRNDPRVEAVSVKIKNLSDQTQLFSTQTGIWNKSTSVSFGQKNWGLYRCQLESNVSNWGTGDPERTSTISLTSTGKNVDVVVVDEILYPDHPEFTGRAIEYDWFREHDTVIRGNETEITQVSRTNNTATIFTASPHRLRVGSVIDVICTDGTFSASAVTVTAVPSTTRFSYANTGSNVTLTSSSGFWRGVYQYPSYTSGNNHATHVAGIIAGSTQGWAREANIYNLRSDSKGFTAGDYTAPEFLIDYIREFHINKPVNPATGRPNPTLVNNSWGFGVVVFAQNNFYTGNPKYSKINYRGNIVTPSGDPVDTGISGVFNTDTKISDFFSVAPGSGNRITTSDVTTASVSSIPYVENGITGLTNLGAPTTIGTGGVDDNDDAHWQIPDIGFPIQYLGGTYQSNIYVSSNSYITFGAGYTFLDVVEDSPFIRKIFLSAGDRNCESMYGGVFGTAPNRTYIVRYEGYDGAYGGAYEPSPNVIWEAKFYEAIPNQIDIHIIANANYRGEFTSSELENYGIKITGPAAPLRVDSIDADIQDAINSGIIFVGSAGNSGFKIDNFSVDPAADYNNFFVDNGLPVYYHRGATPGAATNVICVGEIGSDALEYKSTLSNCGPRIDVYAPGTNIISSVYDNSLTLTTTTGIIELTIDGGYAGSGSILGQAGKAAIVTTTPHGLSNGDTITIDDCSQSAYNVSNVSITVIDPVSFSFDILDTGYSSVLEILTGKVKAYGVYQKTSGTSMAAAQVTGILALALEQYPWMTQADARNYIINYAKTGVIADSQGSYSDNQSLQGSPNRFAYHHKERPDQGVVLPKSRQWLRPATGLAFPRQQIRKK